MDLCVLNVAACCPFNPLQVGVGVVAQRVQPGTERDTATCRCAVWVLVIGVKSSMEVEVLLNMDEGDVVLCEELSNASSVVSLITRNVVSVQDWGESSDVVGQSVELSCILGENGENKWEQRE